MKYHYLGNEKTIAFGVWPDIGLADARDKREKARRLLNAGIDPAVQAKLDRISATIAQANTFGAIADELMDKLVKEELSTVTLTKNCWLIDQVRPDIGNRPIA